MNAGICRFGAVLLLVACMTQESVVGATEGGAVLSIERVTDRIVALSWSNVPPGFVLQSVDSLAGSKPWEGIPQTPQSQGNQLTVTQATGATGNARFYRLVTKGNPARFLDYMTGI